MKRGTFVGRRNIKIPEANNPNGSRDRGTKIEV